jgi:hypothetical protein
MGFIVDLFTSGGIGTILGGITGLFGNWLKTRHEEKMFDLRSQEKARDREHDIATMKMEGENAIAVANIKRGEADDVASGKALEAAYQMEPKRYLTGTTYQETFIGKWLLIPLFGLLDIFRGLMRPGGTTYMMIMVSMIYWEYKGMMETYAIRPTPEQAHEVMMYLIGTFSYLMITSFVFWYGDRNKQQPPGQLNK